MTHHSHAHPISIVPQAPATQAPLPPLMSTPAGIAQQALKTHLLLGDWVARTTHNWLHTAQLFSLKSDASTWGELLHLHEAFTQRLLQQNQAWLQGCAAWAQQREQLKAANTLSKRVEQEFNLIGQLGQLASDQMTNFSALLENAQVSYAYWLHEKLDPKPGTAMLAQTAPRKVARAA